MTTLIPTGPFLPKIVPGGIAVALYPSDQSYTFEIQRASDSSGTGATSIATDVPGTQQVYVDGLPLDGVDRYYRIRHTGNGDTASSWTGWVGPAKPVLMPDSAKRPAPVLPSFKEERSVSGTVGTATVTLTDPQSRVTLFEFQTTSGTGAASGWSTATAPYTTTVTIAPPESKVEYRVTAYDTNGVSRIIWQSAIPFNPNALLVKITPVSTSATDEQFDVTVTDITGGAAVTLTHTDLNATVTRNGGGADPATFTGATAGTTIRYTMTRGAYSSGKSKTVFVATATGRITGSDSIDMPEKPRDTVPARLSLSKTNYNASTGNWELWIRYYQTDNTGTETEVTTDGPWTGASTGSLLRSYDVRDQNGNAVIPTFPAVAFPGPTHYDSTTPGWKITWASSATQSWSFHMAVNPISLWDGSSTVSVASSTLDVKIPAANGGIGGLDARIYGVVGDGSTDDTTAIQSAFTAGATLSKYVDFGSLTPKVTAPITIAGPGFCFDDAPHGSSGGPGFVASGAGFTSGPVLRFTGTPTTVFGTVRASGTVNASAVHFDHPLLSQAQKLRVYGFTGAGCIVEKAWDCSFLDISCENCGEAPGSSISISSTTAGTTTRFTTSSAHGLRGGDIVYVSGAAQTALNGYRVVYYVSSTQFDVKVTTASSGGAAGTVQKRNYSFAVLAGDDTTNHCVFNRIQSEHATTLAIYVDPTTISTTFTNIHSEQVQSPDASYDAWYLGGASCMYSTVELASAGTPANANLKCNGRNKYGPMRVYSGVASASDIVTRVQNDAGMEFYSCDINGGFGEVAGNTGKVSCFGGHMPLRNGQQTNITYYNTAT